MTDDEKKRWLWRYRGSLEKEKALRADLQEQESRAVKTTAALTGMPGGGRGGNRPGAGRAGSYDFVPEVCAGAAV